MAETLMDESAKNVAFLESGAVWGDEACIVGLAEIESLRRQLAEKQADYDSQQLQLKHTRGERDEARARAERLDGALKYMRNDLAGCLSAFPDGMREAICNTNFNILTLRVEEADAALAARQEEGK